MSGMGNIHNKKIIMGNLVKEIQLQYKQIDENKAELKREISELIPKSFLEDETYNYIDITINRYMSIVHIHFYHETYRFSLEYLYPILKQIKLTNMELDVFEKKLVELEEKQQQYYARKNSDNK